MGNLLTPKELFPNQRVAYKDIIRKKVFCITSDCGFGKTITCLSAFVVLKRKNPDYKLLVVCTANGTKKTWPNEHLKWTHTKGLQVSVLNGTPKQRSQKLDADADVYVVSYNNLKWLLDNNKHKFNMVFGDEGHCLKGSKSKWRSYLIKLSKHAKYRILSTATPKTREEDDYWGLCKYLDNGKSLGCPTVTEFRHRYCKLFLFNKREVWKIDKKKVNELEKKIAHLFINYELHGDSNIPIKVITLNGTMSDASKEKYKTLEKSQCVNSIIHDEHGNRDDDKSLDIMTLKGKLNQLSSGFLYVDESLRITPELLERTANIKSLINQSKKRKTIDVFDDRVRATHKALKLIKKKHGDMPVCIVYYFKHELVQLKRIIKNGVEDTDFDMDKWDNREYPYLFLQYNRSSQSLNLQKGSNVMFFYSPTFNWMDDYQIKMRIARTGQLEDLVYLYRLYMKGTIDDLKHKSLASRSVSSKRFQDFTLKRIS